MKRFVSKCLCIFLAWMLAANLFPSALAEEEEPIESVYISLYTLLCGDNIEEKRALNVETYEENIRFSEPNAWIVSFDPLHPEDYEPYLGPVEGGEIYKGLLTLETEEGHCFDENTEIFLGDDEIYETIEFETVSGDAHRIILTFSWAASHPWDEEKQERIDPTCSDPGTITDVCSVNSEHIRVRKTPPDPYEHVWGEWNVIQEPTKKEEGLQERFCTRCGEREEKVIPRITIPYTPVYELETSFVMASTIAWSSNENLEAVMESEKRPATVFVWLDSALHVYDRSGVLLSKDLDSFIPRLAEKMIPAFYIEDAETAAALKTWLTEAGMLDCFVVSKPENRELVKEVADLLHVRGMLDYSSEDSPDREALLDMIASVNGAHGKVILLSEKAADRETVRFLQRLASTVWVKSSSDMKSLLTHYTNGVNGVLVEDPAAAIKAQEFFHDSAPSLLRIPFVIGHRGDPSVYAENTIESAMGAYEEGADSIENDIQLSSDRELFILHDETMRRLLNVQETTEEGMDVLAESWSLEKIQSIPFDWESILSENEVPLENSRYGKFYGQEEQYSYSVPTLRQYYETFKGKDVVHDTEIKSINPEIIPVFKAVTDACDAWDQVFSITFNEAILNEIYEKYPEISIGVLGVAISGKMLDYMAELDDYEKITEESGKEAAVYALYRDIDRWNATYNPMFVVYGKEMVKAARHRGLTVWPWTYMRPEDFAREYLDGMTGLTTDYPWFAENFITEIPSEDVTCASSEEIEKPFGITQKGERIRLETAEAVEAEKLSDTETLMIWRYPAELVINGESYGSYVLYSNPFVWTHVHAWSDPEYTWLNKDAKVRAKRICRIDPSHIEEETVRTVKKTVKPATETEEGEMVITAEFTNPAFRTQTKTVPIPKKKRSEAEVKEETSRYIPPLTVPEKAVRTPDTSDPTNLAGWAVLFALSSLMSAGLLILRRRYTAG